MDKPVYLGLSILDFSKTVIMSFGMIILNQSINKILNYAIQIQIALLFILKLRIFIKALQMILRKVLIHQIMKSIDYYLQEKIKKVIGLMKYELGGKIMTKFVGLRSKT